MTIAARAERKAERELYIRNHQNFSVKQRACTPPLFRLFTPKSMAEALAAMDLASAIV